MNRSVWLLVTLVTMWAGSSSCSFHKKVTRRKAKTIDSVAADIPADTLGVSALQHHTVLPQPDTILSVVEDTSAARQKEIASFTPLWLRRINFNTFSAKAKVHFDGPDDKQEFTANIRLKKDSIIWINASAFGITAARILITRDSIFLLMQLKKEYKRLALKDAAKILPTKVDFAALQNLILGEPLREGTVAYVTTTSSAWVLDGEDSAYIQRITYNKTDSTIRTSQLRTRKANGPQTLAEYGSYEMVNGRKLSTQRVINIQNGEDTYSLDINFQKADFDDLLEFPFSIPDSYSESR